jgi:hypothetical protein
MPGHPSASSFLDTHETAVDTTACSPRAWARHSGWAPTRARIYAALERSDAPIRRLESYRSCGDRVWLLQHREDPTRLKITADTCKSRWCVPCQRDRSFRIRANLKAHLPPHPIRFLTLTIRSHNEPLAELLRRLYGGFRRLRNRSFWRDRVAGGIAFLEVKIGKNSGNWHPHLHVLLQGRYLPHELVRKHWLAVTGDSHVVDIRLVRSRDDVNRYVTKYTTKTTAPSIAHDDHRLDEAIQALRGKRTVIPFGTWAAWGLLRRNDASEWQLYAHENDLAWRARQGDVEAEFLLRVIDTLAHSPGIEFCWHATELTSDLPPPDDIPHHKHSTCSPPPSKSLWDACYPNDH